jgi:hypothetical protein
MISCPNCEATEQTDEETLSGSFGTENQAAWSVQLLVEALERAVTLGRLTDAERIARRATAQVDELVAAGGSIDTKALAGLAIQAIATTLATNDPTWLLWALDIYRRTDRVPPLEVVDRIGEAAAKHPGVARGALVALLQHLDGTARSASPNDMDAIARLEKMRGAAEPGPPDGADATGEWPEVT